MLIFVIKKKRSNNSAQLETIFVLLVDINVIQTHGLGVITCAVAAVSVRVQLPSRVTGAFHCGLVLLTHLAAL